MYHSDSHENKPFSLKLVATCQISARFWLWHRHVISLACHRYFIITITVAPYTFDITVCRSIAIDLRIILCERLILWHGPYIILRPISKSGRNKFSFESELIARGIKNYLEISWLIDMQYFLSFIYKLIIKKIVWCITSYSFPLYIAPRMNGLGPIFW